MSSKWTCLPVILASAGDRGARRGAPACSRGRACRLSRLRFRAFVGTTSRSVVGAALEKRRLLDNEALNFLNYPWSRWSRCLHLHP